MNDYGFRNNYFDWLTEIIGGKNGYSLLLYKLFEMEFYWIVPFDDDRAKDGMELRRTYLEMLQTDDRTGMDSVSVLEVLIALAITCEDKIMNDKNLGDRTPKWFWKFIANLGLLSYSDSNWTYESENDIMHIVDIWLSRKYEFDGTGGLFPLHFCDKYFHNDQRKTDLWSQMNAYLQENYDF